MQELYEILKYTLPSLIVFLAVFLVLKKFLDNEHRKSVFDFKKSNLKLITPIRLQAYERSALFLERIGMENLITRVNQPRMSAEQLHLNLITSIRSEYEHNLSQQIYMSSDAWNAVKDAREETVKIIHTAMANIKSKGTAIELATSIFNLLEEYNMPPNQKAIEIIKKEVRRLFWLSR